MFKKGDKVTLIKMWDHKGTVWVRNAVVHSCGKRRTVLMSPTTGECFGRDFDTQNITGAFRTGMYRQSASVVPGHDRMDAAEEFGKAWLEDRRGQYEYSLNRPEATEGYRKCIRKNMEELFDEPKFKID